MRGYSRGVTAISLLAALVSGCSESDLSGSGGASSRADADETPFSDLGNFDRYCTGTLLVDKRLNAPWRGGWIGPRGTAPAGTEVLLSDEMGGWGGYVIDVDGNVFEIDSDVGESLEKSVDFESDCVPDRDDELHPHQGLLNRSMVLLQDTAFFDSRSMSGRRCMVPAGTVFESYSRSVRDGLVEFEGSGLEVICGFRGGYTDTVTHGFPLERQ